MGSGFQSRSGRKRERESERQREGEREGERGRERRGVGRSGLRGKMNYEEDRHTTDMKECQTVLLHAFYHHFISHRQHMEKVPCLFQTIKAPNIPVMINIISEGNNGNHHNVTMRPLWYKTDLCQNVRTRTI